MVDSSICMPFEIESVVPRATQLETTTRMAKLDEGVTGQYTHRSQVLDPCIGFNPFKPELTERVVDNLAHGLAGHTFPAGRLCDAITENGAMEMVAFYLVQVNPADNLAATGTHQILVAAITRRIGNRRFDRMRYALGRIIGWRPRIDVRFEKLPVLQFECQQLIDVRKAGWSQGNEHFSKAYG